MNTTTTLKTTLHQLVVETYDDEILNQVKEYFVSVKTAKDAEKEFEPILEIAKL